MKLQEAHGLIEKITYKPGAVFMIERCAVMDVIRLVVTLQVVNAENPNEKIPINFQRVLREDHFTALNEKNFLAMIRASLLELEIHEVNEFFKIRGEHYIDPHPETFKPSPKFLKEKHENTDAFGYNFDNFDRLRIQNG